MSTPAEFSRLKHEREVKLREHYQQVYAAQRVGFYVHSFFSFLFLL